MAHSNLANGIQLTSDSSPRGSGIDRFIIHHAATTSLAAILSLFQPGGRTVSANYALGNDGTLILAVDENLRAWTSGSASWDGRAVTIEVANSVAGDPWPVSAASFDKLARLIADVSLRYGFPINDNTVLTHQELYIRYGASYATACPGDLQRRKGELLALANKYRAGSSTAGSDGTPIEKEDDMPKTKLYRNADNGDIRFMNTETGFEFGIPNADYVPLIAGWGLIDGFAPGTTVASAINLPGNVFKFAMDLTATSRGDKDHDELSAKLDALMAELEEEDTNG